MHQKDPLLPSLLSLCRKDLRSSLILVSSLAEIGKELGRRWAQLDSESKAEYERASKASKEKFEEEMKNYRPSEEFLRKKAELEAKSGEVTSVSL